jgi:hypothetical protein
LQEYTAVFLNSQIPLAWENPDPLLHDAWLWFARCLWHIFLHSITSVSTLTAKQIFVHCNSAQRCTQGGKGLLDYILPLNQNSKNMDFVDMMVPNILCDLLFSRSQPLKLTDD